MKDERKCQESRRCVRTSKLDQRLRISSSGFCPITNGFKQRFKKYGRRRSGDVIAVERVRSRFPS
jgi:hypothetical protein